jgi:hypothetical protein
MKTQALLVVVLACLIAACASSGPQRSTQASLATSGNADELAAAALRSLVIDRDPQQALASIARANALAANRPELAWLHVRVCMEARGCEPEPVEARLRKLDAANGIVWLGPLARAQSRRDARVEAQILEAMSRAERFDLYWTTLIWRLSSTRSASSVARSNADAPTQQLAATLDSTTDWLSRIVVPTFKPLSTACGQQSMHDAATAARCERIAQAMQRSDTTLVEGLGLGIAQRLASPGSAAATVLDERIATLGYQSQTAGAIVRSQVERDKFSAQMLELMKKLRREQDVSLAILRWAGQPLTPEP